MARIVAMDDSAFQRRMLIRMIKKEGHEVFEAADGYEGLFKIATHRPDLVVTDLVMPNVGGLDVLEVLYNKGYKIPVIVISADIQDSTKDRCKRLGAAAFINKPVKETEVQETLRNILTSLKEVDK